MALGTVSVAVATAVLGLALLAAPARAQKSVNLGANPPGTVFYAVASGIAKVVTDGWALRLAVQPYTGSSTFLPLLNSGELELGLVNAVDMGLAYRGAAMTIGGKNPWTAHARARPACVRRCPATTLAGSSRARRSRWWRRSA